MNKHTPGPWRASKVRHGPQIGSHAHRHHEVFSDCGTGVAVLVWPSEDDGPGVRDERAATARLIAAAPELLAACEDALVRIEDPTGPIGTTEATDALRAAIAKATGGAT